MSWQFFTHDTMWLCHTHISTKFEANRSRNVATGAKLPPKMTLWRNNVTTLLRHGDFFHMVRCSYAIHMFLPNLKQIGRKTRSQSRKTYFRALPLPANIKIQKSGSITTRALAIPIMCPNMKKIGWETKKFKILWIWSWSSSWWWSSSTDQSFIVHPGGGGPDFVLSVEVVGFKDGPPFQGVNNCWLGDHIFLGCRVSQKPFFQDWKVSLKTRF